MTGAIPAEIGALAGRLLDLAAAAEMFALQHDERLDDDSFAGLAELASLLRGVARVASADDPAAEIASLVEWAEHHLGVLRQAYERGGDA
jgi:hypothetical protein